MTIGNGSMTVAGLLFDETELARRARTTLAGCDEGVLVIATGLVPLYRECVVAVRDDEGEALLSSTGGQPVAAAAQLRAHAALMLSPNGSYGVGLTLMGRIVPSKTGHRGIAGIDDPNRVSIALTVERVLVSCPQLNTTAPQHRQELPLDIYAIAEPDVVAANGWRVARHLTRDHQRQVRMLVAHRRGRPATEIIAAQVSELSRWEMQLWWVDESGAHQDRVRFAHPATNLADLGVLVRGVLSSV